MSITSLIGPAISALQIGQGVQSYKATANYVDELEKAAEWQTREARRAYVKRAGDVKTAYAAGGVKVDQGSPLDILAENTFRMGQAEDAIRFNFSARAQRAMSEGYADLLAGISAGLTTALSVADSTRQTLPGLLDELDKPDPIGVQVRDLGLHLDSRLDFDEFPLLLGDS